MPAQPSGSLLPPGSTLVPHRVGHPLRQGKCPATVGATDTRRSSPGDRPHEVLELALQRLAPRVVVPHHYYIWDVLQRQSTLQGAEQWVDARENVEKIHGPRRVYRIEEIDKLEKAVHFFGDYVAFDKEAWLKTGR